MEPIKVRVKSIWNGKVAVRDKYLKACQEGKTMLRIEVAGEFMEIPYSNILGSIKGKSEKPFKDRFSREWHFLYYFDWKPNAGPMRLF